MSQARARFVDLRSTVEKRVESEELRVEMKIATETWNDSGSTENGEREEVERRNQAVRPIK